MAIVFGNQISFLVVELWLGRAVVFFRGYRKSHYGKSSGFSADLFEVGLLVFPWGPAFSLGCGFVVGWDALVSVESDWERLFCSLRRCGHLISFFARDPLPYISLI